VFLELKELLKQKLIIRLIWTLPVMAEINIVQEATKPGVSYRTPPQVMWVLSQPGDPLASRAPERPG
jgi:hypothetical protein